MLTFQLTRQICLYLQSLIIVSVKYNLNRDNSFENAKRPNEYERPLFRGYQYMPQFADSPPKSPSSDDEEDEKYEQENEPKKKEKSPKEPYE